MAPRIKVLTKDEAMAAVAVAAEVAQQKVDAAQTSLRRLMKALAALARADKPAA